MIALLIGLVLILWLLVASAIGYAMAFPLKFKPLRTLFGLVFAVGLTALALQDEVRGRDEFEALCTRGGVYEISPSVQGRKLDLIFSATDYQPLPGLIRPTQESTINYLDAATGEIVATAKIYITSGGWLAQQQVVAITSQTGPLLGRNQCRPNAAQEARRRAITNKVLNQIISLFINSVYIEFINALLADAADVKDLAHGLDPRSP